SSGAPPWSALVPYTTRFRSRQRPGVLGEQPARGLGLQVAESQLRQVTGGEPFAGAGGEQHGDGLGAQAARGEQQRVGRLAVQPRSEEHTSELQSRENLVCRL